MLRSISGFGALAVVLGLMGCGGSGKEETYLREANAICAAADKRLAELPRPSSLAQVAKVAEREIAIRKEAISQLGELTPPLDITGAASNVYTDQEAREERAHEVQKAAEHKDRKELRKLREEGKKEFELEANRASIIGLHDCAQL